MDDMLMRELEKIKRKLGVKTKFDYDEYEESVQEIGNTVKLLLANRKENDLTQEELMQSEQAINVLEAALPELPLACMGGVSIYPKVDARGVLLCWEISLNDQLAFVLSKDQILILKAMLNEMIKSEKKIALNIEYQHGKALYGPKK